MFIFFFFSFKNSLRPKSSTHMYPDIMADSEKVKRKKGHFQNSYNFTRFLPPYHLSQSFFSYCIKWFFFLWHIVISVEGGGERVRRSAVRMAAIFKCYCLRSISLTCFLPPLSVKTKRGRGRERGREALQRFEKGRIMRDIHGAIISQAISSLCIYTRMREWYMA